MRSQNLVYPQSSKDVVFNALFPELFKKSKDFDYQKKAQNHKLLQGVKGEELREIIIRLTRQDQCVYYLRIWLITLDYKWIFSGSFWIDALNLFIVPCGIQFPSEPEFAGEVFLEAHIPCDGQTDGVICIPKIMLVTTGVSKHVKLNIAYGITQKDKSSNLTFKQVILDSTRDKL
jgi:hypothetical protein